MSSDIFKYTTWTPQRDAPTSKRGMVAAKMPQASEIGARVLARGGNAIDAAVATAFAVGVVEPWMNGIGGGGYMVIWLAEQQKCVVIDYHMVAPAAAAKDMFPLDESAEKELGFFGWPATKDNRHIHGPHSIAVPGTLAGLALALEEYGTISLAEALAPAIELAENGFPVNNYMTTMIAKDVSVLRQFPATAATFLNSEGDPLFSMEQANPTMIRQPELAATLRTIAEHGPDAFYRGEIGAKIAAYLQSEGTVFAAEDLANYAAKVVEPNTVEYHGHTVFTNAGGCGGTSMTQALMALNKLDTGDSVDRTSQQWHTMASVFRQAFADRFTYLADPERIDVPLSTMLSDAYAAETARAVGEKATPPTASTRDRMGVHHDLAASVPEYMRDGSTTHLGVIDAAGNAVSCTQTLLALFGSRVTVPGTGILMNNGMMWFDPEPGRPNSVAGGKKPLNNMAPALIVRDGTIVASVGASGGRKIMNCNAQQIMNIVDAGETAQGAIDAPRIDCSTTDLVVSSRMDPVVRQELAELGYQLGVRYEGLLTADFSSPMAIRRAEDGTLDGGADTWMYSATCVSVEMVDAE